MSDYKQFSVFLESRNNKELEYKTNAALSDYSTFKIGGPADFIVMPYSAEALIATLECAKNSNVRCEVIGNGSNILFADEGFRGAIICTSKMNKVLFSKNECVCDAGVLLSLLSLTALKKSLTGLEWAYGIPGSVGGAIYMNAGAYGGEISTLVKESVYFDPSSGKVKKFSNAEHEFSYRHSVFADKNFVILSAVLVLKGEEDREKIKAVMDDFMFRRRSKQPLEYPSAGSVFKRYPGYYTAQIIDKAGLKGCRVGGAQVSQKHAGFIVNADNATSKDVLKLIDIIKEKIYGLYNINIETEIRYIV